MECDTHRQSSRRASGKDFGAALPPASSFPRSPTTGRCPANRRRPSSRGTLKKKGRARATDGPSRWLPTREALANEKRSLREEKRKGRDSREITSGRGMAGSLKTQAALCLLASGVLSRSSTLGLRPLATLIFRDRLDSAAPLETRRGWSVGRPPFAGTSRKSNFSHCRAPSLTLQEQAPLHSFLGSRFLTGTGGVTLGSF